MAIKCIFLDNIWSTILIGKEFSFSPPPIFIDWIFEIVVSVQKFWTKNLLKSLYFYRVGWGKMGQF